MSKIIGGPDLKARLDAIANVGPAFTGQWADDTVTGIRHNKPPSKESASNTFTTKVTPKRAGVFGAFWWIFTDRGTRAHDIVARKARTLVFQVGGQTIFAKKVHHPRQRRNPFITRSAQNALQGSAWASLVIQTWNRRRIPGRHRFI